MFVHDELNGGTCAGKDMEVIFTRSTMGAYVVFPTLTTAHIDTSRSDVGNMFGTEEALSRGGTFHRFGEGAPADHVTSNGIILESFDPELFELCSTKVMY